MNSPNLPLRHRTSGGDVRRAIAILLTVRIVCDVKRLAFGVWCEGVGVVSQARRLFPSLTRASTPHLIHTYTHFTTWVRSTCRLSRKNTYLTHRDHPARRDCCSIGRLHLVKPAMWHRTKLSRHHETLIHSEYRRAVHHCSPTQPHQGTPDASIPTTH